MKKSLLIVSALMLGASSGFAQLDSIPNANFDHWMDATHPITWGTSNTLVPGGVNQLTSPNAKGPNSISLATTSFSFGGSTYAVPGIGISNGTIAATSITQHSQTGGFPFREHPVALTGISSYTAGVSPAGDQPAIAILLTRWVSAVMTGTVVTTAGHRDTVGVGKAQPMNSTWGTFTAPILYYPNIPTIAVALQHQGKGAVAPDSAQIILLSSSGLSGAIGSTLWIDSLAFDYGCMLNPAIHSSAAAQDQLPAAGDTIHVNQGASYSRTWTIFVPKGVTSPVTVTLDSVRISAAEITATPAIPGATYTVTTEWANNMIGSGTIACVTVAGFVPSTAPNTFVKVTMTPLLYGGAPIGAAGYPSPAPSVSYIKIGTGTGIASFDQNAFSVSQNKPNPFDGSTTVNFNLPVSGKVDFSVVDVLGRQVYDTNINASAGANTFTFSTDLSSGTYFFSVSDGTNVITKKMVITSGN